MTGNIQVSKSTIEVAEAVIWEFNSSMGDFRVCKSIVKDVKMCGYRSSDSRILFMNKVINERLWKLLRNNKKKVI